MTERVAVSVIVPVLNEAATINELITHVRRVSDIGDVELIVSDGDPQGGTLRAITDTGVIGVFSRRGRGAQMNAGAAVASGDILLFLHADTFLPAGAFGKINAAMKDGRYAGGAFDLGIDSQRRALKIVEGAASLRSRVTRIPYGDQAIFMRRDILNAMGGFKDIPIMEDVDLMRRLKRSGQNIVIIPRKVRTSPRRWEAEGVIYCTLRNWALVTFYMLGIRPDKLVRFYR